MCGGPCPPPPGLRRQSPEDPVQKNTRKSVIKNLSKFHANLKHKDQTDQKCPQIIRRGAANHLLVGKDKNRGPRELLFTQKLLEDEISNNDKKVRKSS